MFTADSSHHLSRKPSRARPRILATLGLILSLEHAYATEFEPVGKAIAAALGTTKAFKKDVAVDGKNISVFYSKNAKGAPEKYAFVEKGVYEPDCTHTWVIGINAASNKVEQVRTVELKCQHAFPTRAASFMDQFKGKGPADVKSLDSSIAGIAKATGSCNLATAAVKRSIVAASKIRGKL